MIKKTFWRVFIKYLFSLVNVGFIVFFLFWTASSTRPAATFFKSSHDNQFYPMQTEAFSHGQTHLRDLPTEELLSLKDPYHPGYNAPFRKYHDVSLYKGKYYLYFGPVPALLSLPVYKIFHLYIDQVYLTLLFCLLGFFVNMGTIKLLSKGNGNSGNWFFQQLAILTLGLGSGLPFLLRRVEVYEVAISGGYLFSSLFAHFFLRYLNYRKKTSMLVLSGASLGLAFGSRPNLILLSLAIAGTFFSLGLRNKMEWKKVWRGLFIFAGSVLPFFVAMLIYNSVRFDNPFEFGNHFQLAGFHAGKVKFFGFSNVVEGLYQYLVSMPIINTTFPFFHLRPEYLNPPKSLYGLEVNGSFFANPIMLMALLGIVFFFRKKTFQENFFFFFQSFLISLSLTTFLFWSSMRYQLDSIHFLFFMAVIFLVKIGDWVKTRRRVRFFTYGILSSFCVWGISYHMAISLDAYEDRYAKVNPRHYWKMARFFYSRNVEYAKGVRAQLVFPKEELENGKRYTLFDGKQKGEDDHFGFYLTYQGDNQYEVYLEKNKKQYPVQKFSFEKEKIYTIHIFTPELLCQNEKVFTDVFSQYKNLYTMRVIELGQDYRIKENYFEKGCQDYEYSTNPGKNHFIVRNDLVRIQDFL